MRNCDLHTHSYYSDGQISPKDLVRLAKRRKIKTLALTDHNTVKGVKEAIREGKKVGVNIIPAVEITCNKDEVLGYFVDINNKEFLKKLAEEGRKGEDRIKDYCKKVRKAGHDLSFKEIWDKYPKARGNINGFYPLFVLGKKEGIPTFPLAKTLAEEGIHGKKVNRITIIQAIRLIRKAGGVAVLAHPWLEDEVLKEKNFKKYVKAGLKGIEVSNGDNHILREKKHIRRMRNLAKKYKLILTSGTDFHGKELVKQLPGNHDLGSNNCSESVVNKLRVLSCNV